MEDWILLNSITKQKMNEIKEQKRQGKMPFVHKTYRVWITETIGGFVYVDAANEDEAEEVVTELVDHWGVDSMIYVNSEECKKQMDDKNISPGKHTHGERETAGAEAISDD